jgi:peptide/nickel transport system substrate-binding protein
MRSALGNVKEIKVDGKYKLTIKLQTPSAAFPTNVVYYPCNLIAPDSEAQVNTHPIGCGPFKFVKWERFAATTLERFENYFETDAQGNPLPYLERLEGPPTRADQVRLTALRTGAVDLYRQHVVCRRRGVSPALRRAISDLGDLGAGYGLYHL